MWTLEDEQALREDLIEKIISKANEGDGMLSRAELGSFSYAGQTIRVIDSCVMSYQNFLEERRKLMAQKMKRYFQSLGEVEMETE